MYFAYIHPPKYVWPIQRIVNLFSVYFSLFSWNTFLDIYLYFLYLLLPSLSFSFITLIFHSPLICLHLFFVFVISQIILIFAKYLIPYFLSEAMTQEKILHALQYIFCAFIKLAIFWDNKKYIYIKHSVVTGHFASNLTA